jgi:hypothetical protein
MKPTSWLINMSRGPIVNEDALIQALQSNRIAGAALDVFNTEPLRQMICSEHFPTSWVHLTLVMSLVNSTRSIIPIRLQRSSHGLMIKGQSLRYPGERSITETAGPDWRWSRG